jgi:hypothetical protein
MILATLALACSSSGSADLTLTDLDDPSGHLEESWSGVSVFWYWSDSETELWQLSESSGLFTSLGEVRVDSLSISTAASDCEELQSYLDVGTTLTAQLEDGDAVADHCDALTTYFDDLAALYEADGEERLHLGISISDLVGGTPGTGNWSTPQLNGALLWNDGQDPQVDAGWDADACTFTYIAPSNESQLWSMTDLALTVDEAESSVVGSLDADILGDDGGAAVLTASFDAELCQYSGGAVVLPSL